MARGDEDIRLPAFRAGEKKDSPPGPAVRRCRHRADDVLAMCGHLVNDFVGICVESAKYQGRIEHVRRR